MYAWDALLTMDVGSAVLTVPALELAPDTTASNARSWANLR